MLTTLNYFREEYEAHIKEKKCPAAVCDALMISPCQHTCPVGINIPKYVAHIAAGEYLEAVEPSGSVIPSRLSVAVSAIIPAKAGAAVENLMNPWLSDHSSVLPLIGISSISRNYQAGAIPPEPTQSSRSRGRSHWIILCLLPGADGLSGTLLKPFP